MAKMKPKRYGERLDLTSGGEALPVPILGGSAFLALDKKEEEAMLRHSEVIKVLPSVPVVGVQEPTEGKGLPDTTQGSVQGS